MEKPLWKILFSYIKQYGKKVAVTGITIIFLWYLIWALFFTPFPVYILDRLNLRPIFLPNMTCNHCTNFTYPYFIENKDFCGKEDVFLLIMVASYHPNVDARKAIRQTWGSVKQHKGLSVKTLFIFGRHADKNFNGQIQYELEHYGDVMHADFYDNYKALSNKTMVGLQWVTKFCPQARYVLKTDDDSFNVPQRYVDYLVNIHVEKFIGGYCFTIMPDRSPSSKFYTPYSMYPEKYYPTYCSGPGYVLSMSAIQDIVQVAPNMRFLFMEDVFVTGMCRVGAQIQYIQIEGTVISKHQMTKCNVATWAKNSHNTLPQEAVQIWNDNVIPADKVKDCVAVSAGLAIFVFIFMIFWCRILYNLVKKR